MRELFLEGVGSDVSTGAGEVLDFGLAGLLLGVLALCGAGDCDRPLEGVALLPVEGVAAAVTAANNAYEI